MNWNIFLRVPAQLFSLFVAFQVTSSFANGSLAVLLSVYTLGAFVVELFPFILPRKSRENDHSSYCWTRATLYGICLATMVVSGLVLAREGLSISEHRSVVDSSSRRVISAINDDEKTIALVSDDQHLVVAITKKLLERLGYERDELIGKSVEAIIPGFVRATAIRDVIALHDRGHVGYIVRHDESVEFRDKSGRKVIVPMQVVAFRLSVDRVVPRDVLFLMLAD